MTTLEGIGVVRLGKEVVSVCGGNDYPDACGRWTGPMGEMREMGGEVRYIWGAVESRNGG